MKTKQLLNEEKASDGERQVSTRRAIGHPRRSAVLIVEDDPDMASLLQYSLLKEGYGTLVAHDGRRALALAMQRAPSLILLDLMLPFLSGCELCRILKGDPLTRKIPVVVVTALADREDQLKSHAFGADDYVTKPFNVRELMARVGTVLNRENEMALR